MEDYQYLVREYEKKQLERRQYCKLTPIHANILANRTILPKAIHEGKLLYLGYGRNAWHNTWIRRYYSGSISFFEKDLQKLGETLRVQGSVFRIEPIPAIFIEYSNDVIVVAAINDENASAYEALMNKVLPFRLDAFWNAEEFSVQNWLITFKMAGWYPELLPKSHQRLTSSPRGTKFSMAWHRHDVDDFAGGLCEASRCFMERLLKIKYD